MSTNMLTHYANLNQHDFFKKYGELGREVLSHYGDIDSAIYALDNLYEGPYDNLMEFSMHHFDRLYMDDIPYGAQPFINYLLYRDELFKDNYFSIKVDGMHHVFETEKNN